MSALEYLLWLGMGFCLGICCTMFFMIDSKPVPMKAGTYNLNFPTVAATLEARPGQILVKQPNGEFRWEYPAVQCAELDEGGNVMSEKRPCLKPSRPIGAGIYPDFITGWDGK